MSISASRHALFQEMNTRQKTFAGFLVLSLALLLTSGEMARAQLAGTGAISGTVQDATGAVIPNATVTAINTKTNENTVRSTTKAGDYNITPLPPGSYVVTVSAKGFEGFKQENITVDALATVGLNVTLT